MWTSSIRAACLLVGTFAVLLGCGDHRPTLYPGHGTVTAIDPVARKVTVDHGDIPGLMAAMTMTFDVAPDVLLGDIAPGTRVDFELIHEGDAYTVTSLEPAAAAPAP